MIDRLVRRTPAWACALLLLAATALLLRADLSAKADDAAADAAMPESAVVHFDRNVAPLLARHCLECHNASDLKGGLDLSQQDAATSGGESGVAFVPRDVENSLLWQRVAAGEMPPKGQLSDDERATLRDWIAAGADWGSGTIDRFAFTTDKRAGYDWWSLQPVTQPAVPAVNAKNWPRGDLDRFVLAGLEARGLAPSPEADPRALVRRLTYDLTGLPPTPEEVAAFLDDAAEDTDGAYERLVERLLASPHYGERWTRHWLDVIRFGESQGFERDKLRTNAWPYLDWLVAAFNDDLPYDEFVRLQLAGDVLRPDDPLAVAATGFLVAGAYDEVGQTQQSLAMRAVVRQDELEDFVAVVGQGFLGLTVNCARCHDHKFDPVRQKEYYQLTAALAGVRHGERERLSESGREVAQQRIAAFDAQIAALSEWRDAIVAPHRAALLAERQGHAPRVEPPRPLAAWEFDADFNDGLGGLHGASFGGARLERGRLILEGESYIATAPLAAPLRAKTLAAWVAVADLAQQAGGVMGVQTLDGGVFDALVYAEREAGQWLAGSNFFSRTQSFAGQKEELAAPDLVHVALVYGEDGTIAAYRNGVPYGQAYASSGLQPFEAGQSQVVFGLRHAPAGGNKHFHGEIDRAALYDRALTAEEVAAAAGAIAQPAVTEEELLAALSSDERGAWLDLTRALSAVEARRALTAGGVTYLSTPSEPEPTHVLLRGNTTQPDVLVAAAGIASLNGVIADFGLSPDAPEAERRRKLAAWIADAGNPLTARVIVNRLWMHHFGAGLVETPNDFGFNGGRPSHAELLDWLAADLVAHGWSLKHIHRQIVLSAAYRQSSRYDAAAAAIDADNRLLWRKSPQRLEAEAVRDAVLSVAGQLNPTLGGPGYQDFRTFTANSQFYEMIDAVGWQFQRRSLYRTWVRSGTSPLLDVLDCPDPSTTTPRRAVTTTPLQALALLNDAFMLRMSQAFAARLEGECGGDIALQAGRAYQLAYGREAAEEEIAVAAPFIRQHGLAAFCRVVFNSNEFLYVD